MVGALGRAGGKVGWCCTRSGGGDECWGEGGGGAGAIEVWA